MTQFFLRRGRGSKSVRLGRLLGEGAAGKVHAIDDLPGTAAKLYHPGRATAEHEAKIDMMLANPPALPPLRQDGLDYPQIAWPQSKLYAADGSFAGFLMPEIDFARSTSLVNLLQKSSRRAEQLSDYYGYRVLVARNLASVIAALHEAGHHMIDMKPANLRFYPATSWMAVVDTDGFAIAGRTGRSPAAQVSDEYIAPENWNRRPEELGVEQDRFALSVIVFQLMNNGLHPYAGAGNGVADIQGRIQANAYSYGLDGRDDVAPSAASLHRMFKRSTREMFDRAFGARDPRPTAEDWREHLDTLLGQLVPCRTKPTEHVHFGAGCGFCAHEARIEGVVAGARRARRPAPPARERAAATRQSLTPPAPPPPPRRSRSKARSQPPRRAAIRRGESLWPAVISLGSIAAVVLLASNLEFARSLLPAPGVAPPAIAASGGAGVPAMVSAESGRVVQADCSGRGNAVDQQVCATPELMIAERRIAERYTILAGRTEGYGRLFLIEDQALWMQRRARCGTAADIGRCLAEAYRGRLADLAAWPLDGAPPPAEIVAARADAEAKTRSSALALGNKLILSADR